MIANVPADPDALPISVDLEFGGNCSKRPPREEMLADLKSFIAIVEAHSGKPVMLYLFDDFERQYRITGEIDRKLWRRSLYWHPPEGRWDIWQSHNWTRVNGIEGPVDWNAAKALP